MKKLAVADATLRACEHADNALGFKEKIEIFKQLDRLCVDVIETAPVSKGRSDVLFLHAIAPLSQKCVISCAMPLDETMLELTVEAVQKAAKPRINIFAPVSAVQMEYQCHKKPEAVLEKIAAVTALVRERGIETEVSFTDATRAEHDFLCAAVKAAIAAGAQVITLCDTAGTMLPEELFDFISKLRQDVPEVTQVTLSVECSDVLHIAPACAIACLRAGVTQFKTAIGVSEMLPLQALADLMKVRGDSLGVSASLNRTAGASIIATVEELIQGKFTTAPERKASSEHGGDWKLSSADDMAAIGIAVKKLGYELSAEDLSNVYKEFQRISSKKELVTPKDLDAIVATTAVQVPPTYTLKNFVITCGNTVTSMAHVVLLKNGEEVEGFSTGDGPIDAAFLSIENIAGRHFELDDFQITAVTEGREAVGSGVVRLRSNGKLYSGKGISTDVIGAGIRAFIAALNKICYEENS
jgi:2-isopropylmalate synthase